MAEAPKEVIAQIGPSGAMVHGKPVRLYASAFPGPPTPLKDELCEAIRALEGIAERKVVMLIQRNAGQSPKMTNPYYHIGHEVVTAFRESLDAFEAGKKVAIVVDSPGGYADYAYRLAKMFQKHCGGFTVYVPRVAKSAATLFALGADEIILNRFAELGPLDVQIDDSDREERLSALDEVHSIDRLNVAAMRAVETQMVYWLVKTGKKIEGLLPKTMQFVSSMMSPLFDKIDTVHYTQMSRALKIGTEYAKRLLQPYGENADTLAEMLTENYPDHGFVIDVEECQSLGLRATEATEKVKEQLDRIAELTVNQNILGTLVTGGDDERQQKDRETA